jgi:cystathionine beta-lyase/cystathionine gamma-synthase
MAIGLNPSPFDVWLTSRSIKTLGVRMDRHAANAMKVAEFLEAHPMVKKVYYPGLPSHKNHEIAKKQMSGFSGIVSVEFNMSLEKTMKLISSLKIFSLAESLGGVESLVDHPASMTHASIPKAEREKIGLTDGLVRFSVGIENIEDMIADLEKGLA